MHAQPPTRIHSPNSPLPARQRADSPTRAGPITPLICHDPTGLRYPHRPNRPALSEVVRVVLRDPAVGTDREQDRFAAVHLLGERTPGFETEVTSGDGFPDVLRRGGEGVTASMTVPSTITY